MPLIGQIFAMIGKFAVHIFITVFGWATIIFFGKVPGDKSIKISIIAVISLFWVILLIGIPYPIVTKVVMGYLPDIVRDNTLFVRIINGVGVFVLPLVVGALSLLLDTKAKRKGLSVFRQFLWGYYYTLAFGVAMLIMIAFAPIINIRRLIKKEKATHTPVMIQKGRYFEVLKMIQGELGGAGIEVEIKNMGVLYGVPMRIMNTIADAFLDAFVSDGHKMLKGKGIQVYIHPSDIMIIGKEEIMQKARTIIATTLAFDPTNMTWSKESQEFEKRGYEIYKDFETNKRPCGYYQTEIKKLMNELSEAVLAYDEWEVIARQLYMIENLILKCELNIE